MAPTGEGQNKHTTQAYLTAPGDTCAVRAIGTTDLVRTPITFSLADNFPGPLHFMVQKVMRTERYGRYSPFMNYRQSTKFLLPCRPRDLVINGSRRPIIHHCEITQPGFFQSRATNNDVDGDVDQVFCKVEVIFHVTHEPQL